MRFSRRGPFGATDWGQILALYDQLLVVIADAGGGMNRAIALGEIDGLSRLSTPLDGLDSRWYHLYHAARADLKLLRVWTARTRQ